MPIFAKIEMGIHILYFYVTLTHPANLVLELNDLLFSRLDILMRCDFKLLFALIGIVRINVFLAFLE